MKVVWDSAEWEAGGSAATAAPLGVCVGETQSHSALIFQPCASKSDVTQITRYFSISSPSPACAEALPHNPLFSVLHPEWMQIMGEKKGGKRQRDGERERLLVKKRN